MSEVSSLKGTNGTIIIYEDKVIISRSGFVSKVIQDFRGDRTIYFNDISAIDFKKPGLTNGYIQFVMAGSMSQGVKNTLFKTSKDTMKDPSTVVLRSMSGKRKKEIEDFYQTLLESFESAKSSKSHSAPHASTADELLKYKKLLDEGIISKDEFDKEKLKLLS